MGIDRRHLSLLLGGLLVSELGSGATDVVVAWLVYVHTGSAGLTGLVWASSALAMLVGGPLSGYLADRLPRRRAMIAADAARAVLVAGLGLALLTGWFSLPVLLAAIFVEALLMLLFEGALQALVPTLSGGELERFNGRLQAARMIGGLAGPALGGLLLTTTSHPGSALLLDAATFVVSLCAVAAIAIDEPERAAGGGAGAVFAGLGAIRSVPALRRLTAFAVSLSVLVPILFVSLPLIASGTGAGGLGYGLLSSGLVLGMAVGALPAASLAERLGGSRLVAAGLAVSAAATVLLAWSPVYGVALAAALLIGFAIGPVEVVFISSFQRAAPPELLGRAMTQLISLNAVVRAPAFAGVGLLFGAAGLGPVLLAAALLQLAGAATYVPMAASVAPTPSSSAARS